MAYQQGIAQTRIEVQRVGRGATDPEILEDATKGKAGENSEEV